MEDTVKITVIATGFAAGIKEKSQPQKNKDVIKIASSKSTISSAQKISPYSSDLIDKPSIYKNDNYDTPAILRRAQE